MTQTEAILIADLVILLLRQRGLVGHHQHHHREGLKERTDTPALVPLPAQPILLQGPRGPKGDKGDKGDNGDRGPSLPYGPSPWRIYVDFSSTNPVEDGTEHNPFHTMAQAMAKWSTLGIIPAHILVGGQGGAASDAVTVPEGVHGTIEGIERSFPTIDNISIASGDNNGSGSVSLRNIATGPITLRDRVGAAPDDLGIVVLDRVWVTGGIESLPGQHTAIVVASGLSQVTPTNLSPSMLLEGGPLSLRSGLLVADNARINGGLDCGAFHISGCFYVGTINLRAPYIFHSRFMRTEFQDPFTIDADAAAEVWFDAQSAERFGLIGADCTANVTPLSNGFGPMLRRVSAQVDPFAPVHSNGMLTVEPAKSVPDNDVIGVCFPGRTSGQIGLIWPSGTQIPAQPGANGTYYRDDGSGTATMTPPAGSQRLFHCDGLVCAVGLSFKES